MTINYSLKIAKNLLTCETSKRELIKQKRKVNWEITPRNIILDFEGYAMKPTAKDLINGKISSLGILSSVEIYLHIK